jgi:hypothetical protein
VDSPLALGGDLARDFKGRVNVKHDAEWASASFREAEVEKDLRPTLFLSMRHDEGNFHCLR